MSEAVGRIKVEAERRTITETYVLPEERRVRTRPDGTEKVGFVALQVITRHDRDLRAYRTRVDRVIEWEDGSLTTLFKTGSPDSVRPTHWRVGRHSVKRMREAHEDFVADKVVGAAQFEALRAWAAEL